MSFEDKEKQAVVDETKDVAEPTTKVDGAQEGDNFEQLLAEFSESTKTVDSPPETKSRDELLAKVKDEVYAKIRQENETKSAVQSLVKTLRGEVPEDVFSDEEIEDWASGQAMRNKELSNAWMQRSTKPQVWKKIENELSRRLNKKWQNLPDPIASADHNAVAAAVRGQSTRSTAEPPPNFGEMSEAEFREYTRKNFKF